MQRALTRRTVLAALAASGASCRKRDPQAGRDRPLVIAFGPLHAPRNAEALRANLAQTSQLQLELRVAPSNNEAIDLVQAGTADAGLLPLFDYLFCAQVFGVEPLVQVLRAAEQASHAGELVVREDSPVRELRQLGGLRVGYVDRYSVTGFLLPAALLRQSGVTVEAAWLGTHAAILAAVRDGKVAAGATWAGHAKAQSGLRVLAVTGTVANEPVFVQSRLPADVREALRRGLLAAHDPEALEGLADTTGFRAPPRGTYEAALTTVKAAGQTVEDLVEGGWTRANEHLRPLWSYGP